MTKDFANIPAIAAIAVGKAGPELNFTFPEVLNVIKLCSSNGIAGLGIEMFVVKSDGFYALLFGL
jgi:hypothetical protein